MINKHMPPKIIVTGAFGFLGRHTCLAAHKAGYCIIGLGHGVWGTESPGEWGISEWYECDIEVSSLNRYCDQPKAIIHCAGSGSVAYSLASPYEDYSRSVETTRQVLQYVHQQSKDTVIILPSSAGVYGATEIMPIGIDCRLAPISPYGSHKMISEELCTIYGQYLGIRTSIIRLFSIYGAGLRKQLLWDACSKLLNGNANFSGTGSETRDWIHVSDAANLLIRSIQYADTTPTIINGGSGIARTNADTLRRLSKHLGLKTPDIQFNGRNRPGDPTRFHADIQSALAIGWAPKVSWELGLEQYANWFMKEVK